MSTPRFAAITSQNDLVQRRRAGPACRVARLDQSVGHPVATVDVADQSRVPQQMRPGSCARNARQVLVAGAGTRLLKLPPNADRARTRRSSQVCPRLHGVVEQQRQRLAPAVPAPTRSRRRSTTGAALCRCSRTPASSIAATTPHQGKPSPANQSTPRRPPERVRCHAIYHPEITQRNA